jgi:hypothetical protein
MLRPRHAPCVGADDMDAFWTVVAALLLLAAAAYAQSRIARYTRSPGNATAMRVVLAAIGIALGYIATRFAETPFLAVLSFAIGFGLPHVPAAFILFFKRESGAGRS